MGGGDSDDPADLVRLEIRSALERRIPVIPIAVGGHSFPLPEQELPEDIRALRYRQGLEVRNGSFSSDMAMLVGKLQALMDRPARSPRRPSDPKAVNHGARARNRITVEKLLLTNFFWHSSGLPERDALRMQSSLAERGVAADLAQHYNENAPDAFFVRDPAEGTDRALRAPSASRTSTGHLPLRLPERGVRRVVTIRHERRTSLHPSVPQRRPFRDALPPGRW